MSLLMRMKRCTMATAAAALFGTLLVLPATAAAEGTFKVCADPHYLPMSNRDGEGFENKVAELLAVELGQEVAYTWFPQRMGFIRNTLRKKDQNGQFLCDVVMGVPAGYELVKPTRAWYRSTYVLAVTGDGKLSAAKTTDDVLAMPASERAQLRFGAHERNPGVGWLATNGLLTQLEPYIAQLGDPNVAPGELEGEDLLSGKVDAAILWGPLGAGLARQNPDRDIHLIPIPSDPANGLVMDYAIAMGVHYPNEKMARTLNRLIGEKQEEINAILTEYGVPLLEAGEAGEVSDDDDDDDEGDDDDD